MKSPYERPKFDWEHGTRPPSEPAPSFTRAGVAWISTCLAIAAASLLYRLLVWGELEQTALMFIGLPTFLAILLGLAPPPSSITGKITKGITLALMISGILLVEGLICILIAAPIFLLVGAIIGGTADYLRNRERRSRLHGFAIAALLLTSFEGTTTWLSFGREETVIVTREFPIGAEQAFGALARGPEAFDLDRLPGFLKLGFPAPRSIAGGGLHEGAEWKIHFAGGEGHPGDLVVRVVEASDSRVRFVCLQDSSHIAHWMRWREVVWDIEPLGDDNQTRITMTLRYARALDPAWYFKPLERFGVRLAGEYFMDQTFE